MCVESGLFKSKGFNMKIEIIVNECQEWFRVTGYVHGIRAYSQLEVISFSNTVSKDKLTCGGSVCVPSNIEEAVMVINCMNDALEKAETLMSQYLAEANKSLKE